MLGSILLLGSLSGCRRGDDLLADLPPYHGEWLLPLVQGDASLIQLSQLRSLPLSATVNSAEFGLPSGTYPFVPPIDLPFVGPFPIAIAEYLVVMEVNTTDVTVRLNNPFPIPIGAGTRVVLRNTPVPGVTGNVVLDVPITPQLEANSTFEYVGAATSIEITDTLYLFLEQFNSPGGTNVTFEPTSSSIDIVLSRIEVARMEISTGRSFEREDSLSLSIEQDLQDETDIASGNIVFYADNGLPIEAFFQGYMYDAAGTLLDSLFDSPFVVQAGVTDPTGATTQITTSSDTIPIDPATLDGFLRSSKVVLRYGVSTMDQPGTSVSANSTAALRLQLVGDIRLNVDYDDLR